MIIEHCQDQLFNGEFLLCDVWVVVLEEVGQQDVEVVEGDCVVTVLHDGLQHAEVGLMAGSDNGLHE